EYRGTPQRIRREIQIRTLPNRRFHCVAPFDRYSMRAKSMRVIKMKTCLSLLALSILAVILFPTGAGASKPKFTTCGKPLPLQLKPFTHKPQRIDYLCGNTGCSKGP